MNIKKTANRLKKFMEATEQEVCDLFMTLEGAEKLSYSKTNDIIFVPGTRKDKVLLVAHYDTVWPDGIGVRDVILNGTQMYSNKSGVGTGADNRAGCCLLWMMRTLGHSLLLVPDEEIGCLGSSHMAEYHSKYLEDHKFMLQFDRRGAYDLVFYGTDTKPFVDYMENAYPGYTKSSGSFTDIVELMPAAKCAGCNVSVAFNREHTGDEWLDVLDFVRTAYNTMNLLNREDLPHYEPDLTRDKSRGVFRSSYNHGNWYGNKKSKPNEEYEYQIDDKIIVRRAGKEKEATVVIPGTYCIDVLIKGEKKPTLIYDHHVIRRLDEEPKDLAEYYESLDKKNNSVVTNDNTLVDAVNPLNILYNNRIESFPCPDCGFIFTVDNISDEIYMPAKDEAWCGACYSQFSIQEDAKLCSDFSQAYNLQQDIVLVN